MKAAIYARYSSDQQRDESVEDQIAICQALIAREGWTFAGSYTDRAMSGSSHLRPGYQQLLLYARAGKLDIIVAEALDRISRDQEHVAAFFKQIQFSGMRVVAVAEGDISELHVGLKGTMNALFLKDLAAKTHRGLRGRVAMKRSAGGICYGYRIRRELDPHGEAIRGGRDICGEEAEIVRRIFSTFATGASPSAIAKQLNREDVPGPGGRSWGDSTIRGHAGRGTGILRNELYAGRLVWNRLCYIKDPSTGKRVSRLNPESERIVKEVPDLRIVDDELWQAARTRQDEIAETFAKLTEGVREHHRPNRLNGARRPRSLLSGLITCGCCGGPYALRGADRFTCSNHVSKGTCDNSRTIRREELEARVLAGLKNRMMAPEIVEEAMRAYAQETNRLNRERRSNGHAWRAELAKVEKQITQIVEAIADGMYHQSMKEKMTELEARKEELAPLVAGAIADTPDLLPSAATIYARKIAVLTKALNQRGARPEAVEALRMLIEKIVVTPGPQRGDIFATLHGELSTILDCTERQALGKTKKQTLPERGSRECRHQWLRGPDLN